MKMNQSKINPKVGDTVLVTCVVEAKGINLEGYQIVELKVVDTLGFCSRLPVRFSCYSDYLISSESDKE